MVVFFLSVVVALTLSFACSFTEATLLSLSPGQIAELESKHPKAAATWRRFKSEIEKPITVILILNTAAATMGATIAGSELREVYGERGIAVFSILFTYFMLQFSEILPKTLGVRFNTRAAPVLAQPLSFMIRLFAPVHKLIHIVNRPFERLSGKPQQHDARIEIAALAGMARLYNMIGSQEEKIIRGAVRLSETTLRSAMISVDQITFLCSTQSLQEALVTAHMDPHTRFPICDSDQRDSILGYINFKEIVHRVRTNPNDPSLRGIVRPIHFAQPEETCAQMLKTFVDEHIHMAIVRDAGGKTLGLVTLEDIVEELVGEIEDEFDRLPRMFHELTGGAYVIGGGFPTAVLAEKASLDLPDATGSLSSWLIRRMGRVPKAGENFHYAGVEWVVRRTRRGMIFEVLARRMIEDAEPSSQKGPESTVLTDE